MTISPDGSQAVRLAGLSRRRFLTQGAGLGAGGVGVAALLTSTGATGRRAPLAGTGWYDVTSYGADPSGKEDSSAPIQRAISAAHRAGGGIVCFPTGTYKLTKELTLHPGVSLLGTGSEASMLHQTSPDKPAVISTSAGLNDLSLRIEQLGIFGPGKGQADGIHLTGAPLTYVSLRDLSVFSFGGTGVHLAGPIVCSLERVVSTSNLKHGLWIDGTQSFCTSVSLVACYGNNNAAAGYYINKATYCTLVACAADSNGIGYSFENVTSLCADGCGTESDLSHGLSGYPGVGWKVSGNSEFGSQQVVLNGCFCYDVHDIAYWATGFASGVTLNTCADIAPHKGARYSLKVDAKASVALINPFFANPQNGTGPVTTLADTNEDSHLNTVYATKIVAPVPPRTQTLDASGSDVYTPVSGTTDLAIIAAPSASFTVAAPAGTPDEGQRLAIRIVASAGRTAPTWAPIYVSSSAAALPEALDDGVTLLCDFVYDAGGRRWVLVEAVSYPAS